MLHVCLAVKEVLSSYIWWKETRIGGVKSVPFSHQQSFNFSFKWIKVLCCIIKTERPCLELPALQLWFTFMHIGGKRNTRAIFIHTVRKRLGFFSQQLTQWRLYGVILKQCGWQDVYYYLQVKKDTNIILFHSFGHLYYNAKCCDVKTGWNRLKTIGKKAKRKQLPKLRRKKYSFFT